MLLATVLIRANHAALEHGEVAFERVGVDLVAALAFANIRLGVIDAFVSRDRASELVGLRSVSVQDAVWIDVSVKPSNDFGLRAVHHARRTDATAAFRQAQNLHLVSVAASARMLGL